MSRKKAQVDIVAHYDKKGIKAFNEDIKTLNEKLDKLIKPLEKELPTGTENVNKLSKSVFNLSNAFKLVLVSKITKDLFNLASSCLKASSDMTELENVTTQVFGKMSEDVEKFAKKMANEMGRSVYSIKKYTSDMGAVLKGFGNLDDRAIKEMSQNLATLSVDIGSFMNIDDDQAFNALRGGIVGETESLKRLGIVINDTVMKEYALKQGIKESWETLEASTKAQLRYKAILEKTSFMQGDASRTINTYANQLKVFSANLHNLSGSIGDRLVPVANGVLKVLNGILTATNEWLNKKDISDYTLQFVVARNNIASLYTEYKTLSEKQSLTNDEEQRRLDLFNEMKSLYPDIFKNLTNEKEAYEEIGKAIKNINDELKKKAIQDFLNDKNTEFISKMNGYNTQIAQRQENIEKERASFTVKKGLDINAKAYEDKEFLRLSSEVETYREWLYANGTNETKKFYADKYKNDLSIFQKKLKDYGVDTNNEKVLKDVAQHFHSINNNYRSILSITQEQKKYSDGFEEDLKKEAEILKKTLKSLDKVQEGLVFNKPKPEKGIIEKNNNINIDSNNVKKTFSEYDVMVDEFGEKSEQALTLLLSQKKDELKELVAKFKAGLGEKGSLKAKQNEIDEIKKQLEELKKVNPVEVLKDNIQIINEKLSALKTKQELLNLKDDDLKIDYEKMLNKIKTNFIETISVLISDIDSDSTFKELKEINVDSIKNFLIQNNKNYDNLSKIDKERIQKVLKLYEEYIADEKKLIDKKISEEKKLQDEELKRKKELINASSTAINGVVSSLNIIANLFDNNSEVKDSITKISSFIGDAGSLGISIARVSAGDMNAIPQIINSAFSIIIKATESIVNAFTDFSKEVEEDFKKRNELHKNISSFNNLRNAIEDLTNTIIENTAKLSTEANIQQNKAIFKELNSLYTKKGFEQDVVVNGSYQRQNGIKDGGTRAVLAWFTAGLSEIIPLKKSKFEKTFKLDDFVDIKGKNSKELKELYNKTSDSDLEKLIYKKTEDTVIKENNWGGIARVDIKDFKANTKEIRQSWIKYIEQVEKQEKELAEFDKNVIKESFDGISIVDVSKEKKQILEYYKKIITDENEYNKILPELEKKTDELLKTKSEIVSAFNDVRINTIQQLASGNDTLNSVADGMQTYFNKIRNNIAKIQVESQNGLFKDLDAEMTDKFSEIANSLVTIRLEGKNLSDLKIDFSKQFAKMKELNKINNETIEVVKKIREQALSQGIDISIVDKMLPLGEAKQRALDISNIMRTAMSVALDTNSFNQFSMSIGDSLYKNVKDSLIQAFSDSEKYKALVKKFVITEDFSKKLDNANSLKEAYDIVQKQLIEAENILKGQGLGFRETNSNTGEYLGNSFNNKAPLNSLNTLNSGGLTINVNTTITNNGFLAVDDLTNSLIEKTKQKLNFDKAREV